MAQDQFTLNGTPILEDDLRNYLDDKLINSPDPGESAGADHFAPGAAEASVAALAHAKEEQLADHRHADDRVLLPDPVDEIDASIAALQKQRTRLLQS